MAAAAEPQERERGTLKDTLPRRPSIIVAIVCFISTLLSTALFLYSSPHLLAITVTDLIQYIFAACLGTVSTSVGIVFGDSLAHAFSFGVAVSLMCVQCIFMFYKFIVSLLLLMLYLLYSLFSNTAITYQL